MKKNFVFLFIFLLLNFFNLSYSAEVKNVQAGIKEVLSAKGIGENREQALKEAKADAIMQCINTLVQTEQEKLKFEKVKHKFLYDNADKYIKVDTLEVINKVKVSQGTMIEIKTLVDVGELEKDLAEDNIIKLASKLTEELGDIKILAFFDLKSKGDKPNVYTSWAIDRANWFLGTKNIPYVLQEEALKLASDDDVIRAVKKGTSYIQAIADKAQADIYFKVKADFIKTSDSFAKTKVSIEAYESSTNILIAKKEGESRELAASAGSETSMKAAIEEAMGGVMNDLMVELTKVWKESINQGKNYFILLNYKTNTEKQNFENYLKSICTTVSIKSSKTNLTEYLVKYKGTIKELYKSLRNKLNISRKAQQFNKIELSF